jgi:hypothetical protein
MLALWMMAGCAQLQVESSVSACANYDFDDPAESKLESSVSGDVAQVWRSGVLRGNTDDAFSPTIEPDGDTISVREAWTEGTDGQEYCMEPRITITGLGSTVKVQWYTGQNAVPFDSVEVSPE